MKILPNFWKAVNAKFLNNNLFFVTTPWWLRKLFSGCVWDIKTNKKEFFLTFDDGPHPTITPFVLATLKAYNAKATFFCIGENVKKFPEVYKQIIDNGHAVGNHTMHHINGWNTFDDAYINDINQAASLINSGLFRPPYGRIKKSQIKKIVSKQNVSGITHNNYKVIMWSVLAGDWVSAISPQECFNRVCKSVYPGSIVVLHDSEKANKCMSYTLPKLLEHFSRLGYVFNKIEM